MQPCNKQVNALVTVSGRSKKRQSSFSACPEIAAPFSLSRRESFLTNSNQLQTILSLHISRCLFLWRHCILPGTAQVRLDAVFACVSTQCFLQKPTCSLRVTVTRTAHGSVWVSLGVGRIFDCRSPGSFQKGLTQIYSSWATDTNDWAYYQLECIMVWNNIYLSYLTAWTNKFEIICISVYF